MITHWTLEEDELLKSLYQCTSLKYIKISGRTKSAISHRAQNLGLKPINRWTNKENKIIKKHYLDAKISVLLEKLPNRSIIAIRGQARRLGVIRLVKNNSWTEKEINLLNKHYGKILSRKININKSIQSIQHKAYRLGLKSNLCKLPDYTINNNFFDTPNILNCYYAGLLAADGCIHKRKNHSPRLELSLSGDDVILLKSFKKDIQYTGKILSYHDGNKKHNIKYTINSIINENILNNLKNIFSITERKSLTLEPPQLDDSFALAFIVGFIDGDGCIRRRKTGELCISIYSTKNVLEWIKCHFDNICVSRKKPAKVRKENNSKAHTYTIVGKRAEVICGQLAKIDVPKLARKWQNV